MCGNELLGRGTRCFPSYRCDNCAYHYCIYSAHIQTKVQWNWKQNMTNKSPDPRSGYATERTLQQCGPWNLSSRQHCPKFCIYPNIIRVSCLKKKEVTLRYIPHMTQICFGIPPELEEIRVSGPPDWGFYPQLIPSRFNVRVITVGSMMTGGITKKIK